MKTCTKCGETKGLDAFYAGPRPCKACVSEAAKARYRANPARYIAKAAEYHARHPEVAAKAKAAYRARNVEQHRASSAKRYADPTIRERMQSQMRNLMRQRVVELADGYVRNKLLRGTGIRDAPQALIDLKRAALALHRVVRKAKQLAKETK